MKIIRWTFKGIKMYFPNLTFEEWLSICKHRQHHRRDASDVVEGFNKKIA